MIYRQAKTIARNIKATPALKVTTPEWFERAVCSSVDPDSWFPTQTERGFDAKRVCRSCPVRLECLGYALDHHERHGIWGGLSEYERRRLSA